MQIGISIEELEAVSDVEITEFTAEEGRNDYCYGRYASDSASGYISIRGTWGSLPEDPGELLAAYGDRLLDSVDDQWTYRVEGKATDDWLALTNFTVEPAGGNDPSEARVTEIAIDGIENCTNY